MSRIWPVLVLVALAMFNQAGTCDGGNKDDDDKVVDCPGANRLARLQEEILDSLDEVVGFGRVWEIESIYSEEKPEEFHYSEGNDNLPEKAWTWSAERGTSTVRVRFEVPSLEAPLSCDDLNALGGDDLFSYMTDEEARMYLVYSVMEPITLQLLDLIASGDEEGTSYRGAEYQRWGRYPYTMACDQTCWSVWPCAENVSWTDECPLYEASRSVEASVSIWVDLEDDGSFTAELDIDGSGSYEEWTPPQVESGEAGLDWDPFDFPCDILNECCCPYEPTCATPELFQVTCPAPPGTLWFDQPLEAGTLQDSGTDDDGTWQVTQILSCVENCHCRSGYDDDKCDDGNPCTNDSCQNDECVHVADDSIEPPQASPNDCEKQICENGRVETVAHDEEGPPPDDPTDCRDYYCQDGLRRRADDTEKPPQVSAHDCWEQYCMGGQVQSCADDDEVPPQVAPDDCWEQYCIAGRIESCAADDETPPQASPNDCWEDYCAAGRIEQRPDDTEDPPVIDPTDCMSDVCDGGWRTDDDEDPPQAAPDDCKREICAGGEVFSIEDLTEPGCS